MAKGYLFRATKGGISRVAGLAAFDEVPGLENIDVTSFVAGHMAYRTAMPILLRHVGWEVESDEFAEIVDPDPEDHGTRQRELIREIEDARKEAQTKPDKRRFGFFKRGKIAEKKNWEMYEVKMGGSGEKNGSKDALTEANGRGDSRVLFDIDAIKRELESESVEVRQLETTMPALKLDLSPRKQSSEDTNPSIDGVAAPIGKAKTDKIPQGPFGEPLKTSKSFDASSLPSHAVDDDPPYISHTNTAPSTSTAHNTNSHYSPDDDDALSPSQPAPATNSQFQPLPSASLAWQNTSKTPFSATQSDLRSTQTMSIDHNAWADEEEDEGWGKEKEVVMSFE